jgi:hypothetical protein
LIVDNTSAQDPSCVEQIYPTAGSPIISLSMIVFMGFGTVVEGVQNHQAD